MGSYLYRWTRIKPYIPGGSVFQTHITIIVPVRNEENNVASCLAAIASQKYPKEKTEVIVVNDHSMDRTAEIVQKLNYANLKVLNLSPDSAGKKAAIALGVKNASGQLVITTDADCTMGSDWLTSLVSFYETEKPKMIIGPVLLKDENRIQEKMQSQEMTVLTACACASAANGSPILCSGANLTYEKKLFEDVSGFEDVDKQPSGDDMFLMLKVQAKFPGSIKYLKSTDAVVFTGPAGSSSQALSQRKRWASKTFSYETGSVTGIAVLIFLANFFIVFSGIISAINLKFVWIAAICLGAKFLVDLMVLTSASSFFGKKVHPFVFVIASFIYPVYVSLIGLIAPFTNYSWRSRTS